MQINGDRCWIWRNKTDQIVNLFRFLIRLDKRKNPNQCGSDFVVQVRGLEPP